MNIIEKVYNILERNHKNMQIRSSGSTPGAKLEKIRSGQSYLHHPKRNDADCQEDKNACKTRARQLWIYRSKASAEGIRLANSPLLPDETTEPNLGSYSFDDSKEPVSVSRDAYGIPENVIEGLDKLGIPYKASEAIPFLTPNDSIITRK